MAQQRTNTGISNRETPDEEARGRAHHPAGAPDAPPESDGQGDMSDRELSNKVGTRSNAQKQAGTRHAERPAPPSQKVAGAFGKEARPNDQE
jgi:hypothetical protein